MVFAHGNDIIGTKCVDGNFVGNKLLGKCRNCQKEKQKNKRELLHKVILSIRNFCIENGLTKNELFVRIV